MEGPPNKFLSPKKGFSVQKIPNSGAKESNENDILGRNQINAKIQNPKKPMAKNFMSPTISAASKVSVPRKKILGEMNGISTLSRSASFGSRNDLSPKIILSKSFGLESADDEKISMVAYDPSSNYLSPRPKYLRFNPNRKFEEIDFKKLLDEEESSSGDDENEGLANTENEGNEGKQMNDSLNVDINDSLVFEKGRQDCEENVEGNSGVNADNEVKQMDNSLNVVIRDSLVSEKGKRDCYDKVEGKSVVNTENEGKRMNHSLDVDLSDSLVYEKGEQDWEDNKVEEDGEEEVEQCEKVKGWSLKGIMKILVVLSVFVLAASFLFSMDYNVLDSEDVIAGPVYGSNGIREIILEDLSMCMPKDGYGTDMCMPEDGYGTYMDVVQLDFEKAKQDEIDEDVVMESGHEPVEIVEAQVEWIDVAGNSESDNFIHRGELEGIKEQSEMPDDGMESVDLGAKNDVVANSGSANLINIKEQSGMPEYEFEHVELGVEHKSGEEQTPMLQQKIKNTSPIILGIIGALFCMVSGSLFSISRSKGRKASEKLVLTEAPSPVTPEMKEQKIAAEPRVAKEYGQIRGPAIQLLQNLVFTEIEKSLRRCDQNVHGELVESEYGNNMQDGKENSAVQITSSPVLESSAVYDSCYGSFTTEPRILKKEKGKDSEFTTPVRRSSRIRSKSVTST